MDFELGELDVYDAGKPPNLDLSWPTSKKIQLIQEWIENEYQQFSDFEFSNIGDEEEIINADGLVEEIYSEATDTRSIVLSFFGNSILANQLDDIVRSIEEEYSEDWLPSDDRILLGTVPYSEETDTGDMVVELSEVMSAFDDIVSILEALRKDLPANFGHNRGNDFPLRLENIQRIEKELKSLNEKMQFSAKLSAEDKRNAKLVGRKVKELGQSLSSHVGAMLSVSTLKFSEKFGETAGSWAGRAAILLVFGEKLAQLIL